MQLSKRKDSRTLGQTGVLAAVTGSSGTVPEAVPFEVHTEVRILLLSELTVLSSLWRS